MADPLVISQLTHEKLSQKTSSSQKISPVSKTSGWNIDGFGGRFEKILINVKFFGIIGVINEKLNDWQVCKYIFI